MLSKGAYAIRISQIDETRVTILALYAGLNGLLAFYLSLKHSMRTATTDKTILKKNASLDKLNVVSALVAYILSLFLTAKYFSGMEYFIFILSPIVMLIPKPSGSGRYAILVSCIISISLVTSVWQLCLEPILTEESIWWFDILLVLLLLPSLYSIVWHAWKPHAYNFKYTRWLTLGPLTFLTLLLAYSVIIKLLSLFSLVVTILLISVNYYKSRVSLQIL